MRPASSVVLVGAVLLASGLVGVTAHAEDPPAAKRNYKPQPLNLEKRNPVAQALIDAGRGRMKTGDCQGALDAFDGALRVTLDPSVYRDRGICNEKLGYPFPAMDDYRVYLTQRPDAPDADDIRERLARLEGGGDDEDKPDAPAARHGSAHGAGGNKDDDLPSEDAHLDNLDYSSRDESVGTSPLRAGSGAMLYPFFSEHKWVATTGGSSPVLASPVASSLVGDDATWSESVGVGFRWAFNVSGSLVVEGGYERFNATGTDVFTMSGMTSLVAYELRFPLDPAYGNQLFFAPGVGYEHLSIQSNDPTFSSGTAGAVVPRVRFGYRRMLGHALSLDVSVDAGATKFFQYSGGGALWPSSESAAVLVAANVAVVWGL